MMPLSKEEEVMGIRAHPKAETISITKAKVEVLYYIINLEVEGDGYIRMIRKKDKMAKGKIAGTSSLGKIIKLEEGEDSMMM